MLYICCIGNSALPPPAATVQSRRREPVYPRSAFASSCGLPLGDRPAAAITSCGGLVKSTEFDLAACWRSVVSIVNGSWASSLRFPPEVRVAPEVVCLLTPKRRDGCRSSLGDAGPECRRSDRVDLFDFDEPCLPLQHSRCYLFLVLE